MRTISAHRLFSSLAYELAEGNIRAEKALTSANKQRFAIREEIP
jgi:hypothetical protein